MYSKCTIFGLLILLSVKEFEMTLGLTFESYEIFNENVASEGILKSASRDIVRRETRNKETTRHPGAETEQRPPFRPENPRFTEHTPTVTLSTVSSIRTKVTSSSASTPTARSNHIVNDNHRYYKSRYDSSGAKKWWYSLGKGGIPAVLHEGLSKNQQYSDTIRTSFQFPYYGHLIDYVTITNKGYVFLGDVVHKFNASSQYVAPLMADFTTDNDTVIAYVDTGDRFTVEWRNLIFQDRKVGAFSFQCTILKNGTLIFVYRNIPASVVELKSTSFQQRVGISDSLRYRILRHGIFFINGRLYTTIAHNYYFKYHSVDLPMENVKTGSAYVITPLMNCVMLKSCNSCVNTTTAFKCAWCPELQRCSDGIDRHRQEWFLYGCPTRNQTMCPAKSSTTPGTTMKQVNNTTTPQSSKYTKTTKHIKQDQTTPSEERRMKEYTKSSLEKSSESVQPPTINVKTTVHSTEKWKYNHTTPTKPTKETTKTIHKNATNKVTVVSTDKRNVTTVTPKPFIRSTKRNANEANKINKPFNIQGNHGARSGSRSSDVSSVGVGLIVLSLVIILVGLGGWFVYAYRHPQTRSGRFLIEHRNPRRWFKNSGETSGKVHYKTKTMELTET